MAEFSILVSKADFKFNCAHFIAYKGFRERLHGHNYQVGVQVFGGNIHPNGYLIDFGDIKKALRKICKSFNEYFICPMKSDTVSVTEFESNLCLECEDGAKFSFPKADCLQLPIVHSSAEELAHYLYCAVVREIGVEYLLTHGLGLMEISLSEAQNQTACFRCPLPKSEEELLKIEAFAFISKPQPCSERIYHCYNLTDYY